MGVLTVLKNTENKGIFRKGFTLIELLIILAVVAILMAAIARLALPAITGEAKTTKLWEAIQKASKAIQTFAADTTEYPSAIKQLWTGKDSNGNPIQGWRMAYLVPKNPDDENIDLSSIATGATMDVECTEGTDGKVDIVVNNIPKSLAQALDKAYDNGDGPTAGRIQWDDSTNPTTLRYTVAYGQFTPNGIVCVP